MLAERSLPRVAVICPSATWRLGLLFPTLPSHLYDAPLCAHGADRFAPSPGLDRHRLRQARNKIPVTPTSLGWNTFPVPTFTEIEPGGSDSLRREHPAWRARRIFPRRSPISTLLAACRRISARPTTETTRFWSASTSVAASGTIRSVWKGCLRCTRSMDSNGTVD